MNNAVATALCLMLSVGLFAQVDSKTTKIDEYNTFITRVLSTNGTSLKPTFSLDISDKSALKLAVPIIPFMGAAKGTYDSGNGNWASKTQSNSIFKSFYVFADAKISASDNFTSLYKKGKWQTQSEVGGSVTWLPIRKSKFYRAETTKDHVDPQKEDLKYIMPLADMPISKASQVNFFWINMRGGFSYTKNSLIDSLKDNNNTFLGDTIVSDIIKGGYFQSSINWYIYPSKYRTPRLTIFSQAIYKFNGNGTNYDELTKIEGTISSSTTNNNSTVTQEESFKSVRKSDYKVKNKNSIFIQSIALINNLDHSFYFGIGAIMEWKKLAKEKSTTDIGFSINLPINKTKDGENATLANLQLRFIWADVGNNYYKKTELMTKDDYRKQNLNVGFTVSIPIVATHKKQPKKPD